MHLFPEKHLIRTHKPHDVSGLLRIKECVFAEPKKVFIVITFTSRSKSLCFIESKVLQLSCSKIESYFIRLAVGDKYKAIQRIFIKASKV